MWVVQAGRLPQQPSDLLTGAYSASDESASEHEFDESMGMDELEVELEGDEQGEQQEGQQIEGSQSWGLAGGSEEEGEERMDNLSKSRKKRLKRAAQRASSLLSQVQILC